MEGNSICFFSSSSSYFKILFFSLSLFAGLCTASFISDDIFGSQASIGRNLLQAKTPCPVNFEFKNYSIITDQCKGPQYLPDPCCGSFKEFACPYVDDLNDLSNDCASTMFSYINLYGKYPPGLFASFCREGKQGLECPALSPSESANDASGVLNIRNPLHLLFLTAASLMLLLLVF